MKKSELKRLCDECLSGMCEDIISSVVDNMYDDQEYDSLDDLMDDVMYELDSYFTYYSDAWDYLQDNCITDFDEAIKEWGVHDVCGIACYYAREEIWDDVSAYWDEYEGTDEQEDAEEDE